MKKYILLIWILVFPVASLLAQQKETMLSGTVRSKETQKPLFGVSIVLEKSGKQTFSNDSGRFIIAAPWSEDTLVLRYIGYREKKMAVFGTDNLPLVINMTQNTNRLHEVVVSTGYQNIPKERATGSFDFIDNTTLNQQTGPTILSRIKGVSSSVMFPKSNLQKGPDFMIRGLSTINGPKDPLIIVDNFPYDGDITNINPDDVKSISILKDAAAASIWGVRAGNGVVVITTKKGRNNQPLTVNMHTSISVTGKPDILSLRTIFSTDYIGVEQMLFAKGYYDRYLNDTYRYPAISPVISILEKQKQGQLSSAQAADQINRLKNVDIRTQYNKYMYQPAIDQQYFLNMEGGSHNMTYYFSAGYNKATDKLSGTNDRLAFKARNTYSPLKNLHLSLGVQYTQIHDGSGKPPFGTIGIYNEQWQVPYIQLADQNGRPLSVPIVYRQAYTDTAGAGTLLDWNYYPLEDYRHNTTRLSQQDILADLGLHYTLYKDIDLSVKYRYEKQEGLSENHQDIQSYAARDMINRFSQINSVTGAVNYIVPKGDILSRSDTYIKTQDVRGQVNYNHSWKKSNLVFMAGSEVRQMKTSGNSAILYGYDPKTDVTQGVDYANRYPTLPAGHTGVIPGSGSLSDQLNRYVSLYANASYNFDSKYTVSVSGRRDASNLFGVSTNNKWNPLWSAGFGWQISNEPFYHVSWLPKLKLRLTDGYSGNTDPSRTGVTTLVISGPLSPSHLPTSRVNQFPNPDLRWEKIQMFNAGIDFRSIKGILKGSVEAYIKKGSDLYGAAPFDPTAGLNGQAGIVRNIANMQGKGIDINIESRNLDHKLKWSTRILFSYNTDKTTKYYVDSNRRSGSFINDGFLINPLVGKPLYAIIALPWGGLDDQGNPKGYVDQKLSTDYYTITQQTRKEDLIYRPSLPKIFGSLINTFSWKSIRLSVNIGYRFDYYFMKPSLSYTSLFEHGARVGSADFSKRWKQPGDDRYTNVPSMIYPANNNRDIFYNASTTLLRRADNIRLRYLNLSYDIIEGKHHLLPFQHLQVYLHAENLGILWRRNKDGLDPDYISSLPGPGTTWSVGIRAKF